VEQAEANLGEGRIETLVYDKAADDVKGQETPHDHPIKPVIPARAPWQEGKGKALRVGLPLVYDEAGTVLGYDTVSDPPATKQMACIGFEKGRGAVTYRCPARHAGRPCPRLEKGTGEKKYGLVVRARCADDRRRFPAVGRAAKQFERLSRGRTAVGRVHARRQTFWGVDDGNVVGARRLHAPGGVVRVVHVALARWLAQQPR
jgi:hypothetical protein